MREHSYTYLFWHQSTGKVKAYKKMSHTQARTANSRLAQEMNLCRWVLEPLPEFIYQEKQADVTKSAS